MLIMFLMHYMAIALFRLIGAIGRTMVIANTLGSLTLLIVFVLGGFILRRRELALAPSPPRCSWSVCLRWQVLQL